MRIEWFGQSAFRLDGGGQTVFIDPFGVPGERFAKRGMSFDYPPIEGVDAGLLLITHEHFDHNAAEAVGGDPAVIRSTAGRLDSPVGEVVAIASEHDPHAGTDRGPNSIFAFTLDGLRVCHFGDFGQAELRDEQAEAIGSVDVLFVPVGGGPTIGAGQATEIARRLGARWIVPMHYRTPMISFLDTADEFLGMHENVVRCETPAFETSDVDGVVVPAPPSR